MSYLVPKSGLLAVFKEVLCASVARLGDQQAFQKERSLAHISRLIWMVKKTNGLTRHCNLTLQCFSRATPESNVGYSALQ